ncbi:MAG: DUF3592 domain-containing protein [Deltaproteobacteria bacterium]|nr:DUF3592 domain-containing protein [Deltaproteobacteria bacterium]
MRARNPDLEMFVPKLARLGKRLAAGDRKSPRQVTEFLADVRPILLAAPDGEGAYDDIERALREKRPDDAVAALTRVAPWPLLAWLRHHFGLIGGLIVLIGGAPGLFCLIAGIDRMTAAAASTTWSTARGRIISSSVECRVSTTSSAGSRGSSGRSHTAVWYIAAVSYSFDVHGRRFDGDRVAFGARLSEPAARATVARYPAGAEVAVRFDPRDPTRSVLEPGRNEHTATLFFGGLAWLAILGVTLGGMRYWYLRHGS